MELKNDFKELLALFNARRVEYLIVGAYALAHHGAPRFTGDIDIWVKPDGDNARRVLGALNEFGFGSVGLTEEDFSKPDKVVQLGVPPNRIDLMTSVSGVTWEEAEKEKASGTADDLSIPFIGRTQFVLNKRASGRTKDLADIEALGET